MCPLFVVEHKRQFGDGAEHESTTRDEDITLKTPSFHSPAGGRREKSRWRIFQSLACIRKRLVMHILMKDCKTNEVLHFIAHLGLGKQRQDPVSNICYVIESLAA